MDKYKILIVEDDEAINNLIKSYLEEEGYIVFQAFSGTEAKFYLKEEIDLFILDLMLPGLSGEEIIEEIRKISQGPILVVSGKAELDDKVNALDLGADDYMTKPFEKRELLARIKVLLRRLALEKKPAEDQLTYKSISLKPKSMEVFVDDKNLSLTQTEFLILYEFLKDPDSVFSRDRLYDSIWGYDYQEGDNAITVHISHLRQKLRQATGEDIIVTVWGVGYKLSK
ncbi:response regulator transcription factor [Neofamilia massiliensis]|uniref:response regulator transcription factor n=1 Tax=Neofamilia massiliensis TaxID=1673724 RepID=UPI0006BB7DBF|nr:response regulator transcription factor [Neofamilia massiliensis]